MYHVVSRQGHRLHLFSLFVHRSAIVLSANHVNVRSLKVKKRFYPCIWMRSSWSIEESVESLSCVKKILYFKIHIMQDKWFES